MKMIVRSLLKNKYPPEDEEYSINTAISPHEM
jgi:hypothetical protein